MPVRTATFLLLLLLGAGCTQPPPNVVVILIDDLGWKDIGAYGSTFYQTPHIDRLAAQGVRFTQFYSAGPNCSPTRASIMTGRYPAGLHLTNQVNGRRNGMLRQAEFRRALPLEEVTLGEAFQAAGYATGYIGKWHLGTGGFRAEHQGFETVFASNDSGHPGSHFAPYGSERNQATRVPDLQADEDSTYLTDRLTDAAIEFLQAHQEDPFLLVLSHYAVHTPLHAKSELASRYESTRPNSSFRPELFNAMTREQQGHAVYAGMVASVDESVGRIVDALSRLRLSERTIVVFTSDNGGLSTLSNGRTTAPTAILPLRAGKGWLYEGGVRIPLIIQGYGAAAGGVMDTPGITNDLMPTLLSLTGLPPKENFDGQNLFSENMRDRALYWHFPHYPGGGNRPSGAVRAGRYKLIEWYETGVTELYDLEADLGETTDLSRTMPAKNAELLAMLRTWRTSQDAKMPTPNPDFKGPTRQ